MLRNQNQVTQSLVLRNHYGESTFIYIFAKLINSVSHYDCIIRLIRKNIHDYYYRQYPKIHKDNHDPIEIRLNNTESKIVQIFEGY